MGQKHCKVTVFDLLVPNCEQQIIQLLRNSGTFNQCSPSGESLLRASLDSGLNDLFLFLYEKGAVCTPPVELNGTFLHRAVHQAKYRLARILLKKRTVFGHLKNSKDSKGMTPLHYAVLRGDPEMVALLLKYNADHQICDNKGRSPLDLSLERKSPAHEEFIEQFSAEDSALKRAALREGAVSAGRRFLLEQKLVGSQLLVLKSSEVEFLDLVSRGSSSLVYRGKWRATEIAIKQFKTEYSSSEKETQKFIKEMEVLATVRHPNLLLLMGIVVDSPNLCLITEYVSNGSLFCALHKNHKLVLTLRDRFSISIQIAKALAYLHTNSPPIIHRDLKPENILLDNALCVKIADFGLARPLTCFRQNEGQSLTTICIGTTRFMAPELFDSAVVENVGIEVDIWALGCIFIEVFSNKRPWDYISSSNSNCVFYEIFNKKPVPIPENVPAEVKSIIGNCCEYSPGARPKITDILRKLEEIQLKFL